jgi:hypothetical protein
MNKSLRGIELIDAVLNDFAKNFGVTVRFGADFAYWYEKDEIEYSLIMPEDASIYFMDNFNRLAPDLKCDQFLASFLHEIGHVETFHLLSDIEECFCRDSKDRISRQFTDFITEEEDRALHQEYFDLPDEYEATMWAINYMRENTEKVTLFSNKLQAAIMKFYELNGVVL